jgi:hypothetical protein
MLCSNCSEVVKPVVAIDIDGTLSDYHYHLVQFANDWLGKRPMVQDDYDGGQDYWRWFCESFGVDRTTFRQIKLAYRQGGLKRTQPLWFYADEIVPKLQECGAEVWLTTTRPHDRFDRIDPDTREFLRRNNIPYDGLLYSGAKMRELAERVDPPRVVAVIDDQVNILI